MRHYTEGCVPNDFVLRTLQRRWQDDHGGAEATTEPGGEFASSKARKEFVKAFGESGEGYYEQGGGIGGGSSSNDDHSTRIIWDGGETEPWFFSYLCKGADYATHRCAADTPCGKFVGQAIIEVGSTG